MQLVERAVHAHGDVQVVQAAVLADLVHHGGHAGAADLGRAAGHRAAHLLHDDAVVTGAGEAQLLQDRPDLQQRQAIAVEGEEGGERGERSANSSRVTRYLTAAPGGRGGLKRCIKPPSRTWVCPRVSK